MPDVTEIRLTRAENVLHVTFADGSTAALPAEYLRVESPSAEVQGHQESERQLIAGKRHVGISHIEPVGNYAIRLIFDDRHDTGIFSWDLLYRLGQEYPARWRKYLDALERAGKSR